MNNLFTVRDVADNAANLDTHYEYDSFGNIASGDASLTRYLFTSREWDADISLQFNRARWYDAGVGRWLSVDPIGFSAGDANLYRYVGNGAVQFTDPSGLQEADAASETVLMPLDMRIVAVPMGGVEAPLVGIAQPSPGSPWLPAIVLGNSVRRIDNSPAPREPRNLFPIIPIENNPIPSPEGLPQIPAPDPSWLPPPLLPVPPNSPWPPPSPEGFPQTPPPLKPQGPKLMPGPILPVPPQPRIPSPEGLPQESDPVPPQEPKGLGPPQPPDPRQPPPPKPKEPPKFPGSTLLPGPHPKK